MRTTSFVALAGLLLAASHASDAAYPRPGTTERVSVSTGGAEADGEADYPGISGDGRHVVFESDATTLVAGDSNDSRDVFLHDLATGTTELISVALDGGAGDAGSRSGAVSADGRYVAFESDATNLVPDDTNQDTDIFVRDRQTGSTVLVSEAMGGAPAQAGADQCPNRWRLSFRPSISSDGARIVFASWAENLVPDDTNGCPDIFLRDLSAGTTERVSMSTDGQEPNGTSAEPAISGDGTVVAYQSSSTNLVPAETGEVGGGAIHVYVRDLQAATTERVSVSSSGVRANSHATRPTVSHDGRVVVFPSIATNLVPHDSNTKIDVFAHDRETGRTERVSVGSDGREGDENLGERVPGVSANGRYITFAGDPSNFVQGDENVRQDVFVHDRLTGEIQRISLTDAGEEGDGSSWESAISADGRRIVFLSRATDLVPGDTNAEIDVFVRDRGPELGILDLRSEPQADVVSLSGRAVFSGLRATSASDPAGDGVGALGADLTGASVAVRPESDDLLVRLDLTDVLVIQREGNTDLTVSGAPGVVYGLAFDGGGVRHEIRAGRTSAAAAYTLWRCDGECTQVAELTGTIGTVEAAVLIAVPLSVLPQGPLSQLEAFVDLGDVTQLLGQTQDSLALPDAQIPAPRIELGVAPAGTSEGQVPFDAVAELTDGGFSAALDAAGLPPGGYDLWARACLGEVCGAASRSTPAS